MQTPRSLVDASIANPKKLFVVDALGALLSILLLGVVLPRLEHLLGFGRTELLFLASIPALFIVIDVIGVLRSPKSAHFWVQLIGIANLSYCVISMTTFVLNRENITALGWGYAGAEVLVIAAIGAFELLCAKKMSEAQPQS